MKCIAQCTNSVLNLFYNYGHKVGKYPVPFMVVCVVICGALAAGLTRMDPLTDMEKLYLPEDSQAFKNREEVWDAFPDLTGKHFDSFSLSRDIPRGTFIFRSRHGSNILEKQTLAEIKRFLDRVKAINVTSEGTVYTYEDLCAIAQKRCVMSGDYIFTAKFRDAVDGGIMTYPVAQSFPTTDLAVNIGRPSLNGSGSNLPVLVGAGALFFSYPLRTNNGTESLSIDWEDKFIEQMPELLSNASLSVDVAYSTAKSLNEELDSSTGGDIIFFALTFTIMITYATIVSAGGNMVSTRAFLSTGGVLATCFGIVGSFGLVTLCGVRYVNMAGIMPFLLLGVGVDDMFLLMSAWSETTDHPELTVPQRIGTVFKKAGIGITITSVTNFLSFAIGATSVFLSVRNFCIFTGVGVLFCYFANISFFGGCLTLHGKRAYSNRHTITCRKVKSHAELEAEGHGYLYRLLCGGQKPEKAMEDQSICERGPTYVLPRFILWTPVRIIVIVLFACNLGIAIWGCTVLDEGLDLKDLVLSSSYVHDFENWRDEDFGLKLPVSFVKKGHLDYKSSKTLEEMNRLIREAQEDTLVSDQIEVCWLTEYAKTPLYDNSTDLAFMTGLKTFMSFAPRFENDVVIEDGEIVASRCYVYSNRVDDTHEQAQLMVRMRDLADASPVADFAFHWSFIFFEQFVLILPTTMQTVGITIAVMGVVTAFFLPHPLIVALVMTQVIMIVTCIFGYMALWGLTLSSITMVHLIMSAGLSVDFCAHVCTAYMVSEKGTRQERAKDAIVHASGPILNGGTSSMVGILGLLFSESFIFRSFFKVMLLVIGFGVAHAVFFVPVLLSFIGPKNFVNSGNTDKDHADSNGKVSPYTEVEPNATNAETGTNATGRASQNNQHIELGNIDSKQHELQNGKNGHYVTVIDTTKGDEHVQNGMQQEADTSSYNAEDKRIEHEYTNRGFTSDNMERSNDKSNGENAIQEGNSVQNVQENNNGPVDAENVDLKTRL